MKKQLIFSLALVAFSFQACEIITRPPLELTPEGILSIESIYPEFAISGSEIIITGENFGKDINDNYVTIKGQSSEVTYVEPERRIVALVPKNLDPGEHTLTIFAKGQSSSKIFVIVEDN